MVLSTSKRRPNKISRFYVTDSRYASESGVRVGTKKSDTGAKGGAGWIDRGGLSGYMNGVPDRERGAAYYFKKDSGDDPPVALIRFDL